MGHAVLLAAFLTAFLASGCRTWATEDEQRALESVGPGSGQTDEVRLRLLLPDGIRVRRTSTRDTSSRWGVYPETMGGTLSETSTLVFRKTDDVDPHSSSASAGWSAEAANEVLEFQPLPRGRRHIEGGFRGVRFGFRLNGDGSVGEMGSVSGPHSLRSSWDAGAPSLLAQRFLRSLSWPDWFVLLVNRTVRVGQHLELGEVDYSRGCIVPRPTRRSVTLEAVGWVPCHGAEGGVPDRDYAGPQGAEPTKDRCLALTLELSASPEAIQANLAQLDPDASEGEDIFSSLTLSDPLCVETVRAVVEPHSLRLMQYESRRRIRADVVLAPPDHAAGVTADQPPGRMKIVDEDVTERATFTWSGP